MLFNNQARYLKLRAAPTVEYLQLEGNNKPVIV